MSNSILMCACGYRLLNTEAAYEAGHTLDNKDLLIPGITKDEFFIALENVVCIKCGEKWPCSSVKDAGDKDHEAKVRTL